MASDQLVTLRWNPTLKKEQNRSSKFNKIHEHYSDSSRTIGTYNRRKKAHEDDLLTPLAKNLKDDDAYQQFCDELNDCYDTDMLLMICSKFKVQIEDNVNQSRYAEYLFGKLASWSTQSHRVCNYIANLLNPKPDATTHPVVSTSKNRQLTAQPQNNKEQALENGQQTLKKTLIKLEKEKFFGQLKAEQKVRKNSTQSKPQTSAHANIRSVTYDDDSKILDFLASIHRSSGRKIARLQKKSNLWIEKQNTLIDNASKIDKAISAIDLFPWDSLNREQKFIQKVISALKDQPGREKITLSAGVRNRKTFEFNRNQILVLIRANPSLCAEFKKALAPKPGLFSLGQTTLATLFKTDADARSLFADNSPDFLELARKLLPNLLVAENKPNLDIRERPPRQASNNPADTNRLTVATTTEVVSGSLSSQPTAASLEAQSILSPRTDLSEHATNSSAVNESLHHSSPLLIANFPFNVDESVVANSQQEETTNQGSELDDQPATQSVARLNTLSGAFISASRHRKNITASDLGGMTTLNLRTLTAVPALQILTDQFVRSLLPISLGLQLGSNRFRTAPLGRTLKLENDPTLALGNSSQSVAADPESQLIAGAVTSAKNFDIDEDGLTVTTTTEAVNEITTPIVSQANNPEVDKPPYPLLIANFPFNVDKSVVANSQQENTASVVNQEPEEETANQDSQLDDQRTPEFAAPLNIASDSSESDESEELAPADDIRSDSSESDESEELVLADDILSDSDESEELVPADDIPSDSDDDSQDPGDSASQAAHNHYEEEEENDQNICNANNRESDLTVDALAKHNKHHHNQPPGWTHRHGLWTFFNLDDDNNPGKKSTASVTPSVVN